MTIRTYRDLQALPTLEERFKYLQLSSSVGAKTFGFDRYINQRFYTSREWKRVRDEVIVRDNGCDLGVDGYEIQKFVIIHHMNPITLEDFKQGNQAILDPEYLISTVLPTHNAIHYGDTSLLAIPLPDRRSGDTNLWNPVGRR